MISNDIQKKHTHADEQFDLASIGPGNLHKKFPSSMLRKTLKADNRNLL